jgi:hypothetical protein
LVIEMKSSEAMVEYLAERIGLLYYHLPLAYGGSASGVETLLYAYHNAWSYLVEFDGDWRKAWWKALEAEDCGSADFSTRYSMNHPQASEEEVAAYVVKHWRPVSDELGVPIPHAALEAEFAQWHRDRVK